MVRDLQKKFIAIATLSVTLVMLLVGISINVLNFISTNADLKSTLEMIYENQGSVPSFPPGNKPDRHNNKFTAETPYATRYFVLNYSADGLLDSADMTQIAAVKAADAAEYLSVAKKHGEGFGFTGNYKFYVVKTGTDNYMAIFLDCYNEINSIRTFAALSVATITACIFLVLILVVVLSKRAIKPTVQATEKQKQFITDASHELKTPITVINTSLRVLEMDTGKNRWIDKIHGQTEKLTRLVNALVTLSRLDEETPPFHFSDFNMSEAVSEVIDSFQESAQAGNYFLDAEIPNNIHYRGDEAAIRQLVSILLDNALKYSVAEGKIRISMTTEKKAVLLYAENRSALPLDEEDTGKLFDRFYRGDKSRSGRFDGFGIGLSIAKSIVEAHHGTIRASTDGSRICFEIYLR